MSEAAPEPERCQSAVSAANTPLCKVESSTLHVHASSRGVEYSVRDVVSRVVPHDTVPRRCPRVERSANTPLQKVESFAMLFSAPSCEAEYGMSMSCCTPVSCGFGHDGHESDGIGGAPYQLYFKIHVHGIIGESSYHTGNGMI